jgi:hypothetical protein
MARNTDLGILGLALMGVAAVGCGGQEPDVEVQTAAIETSNALTANALTANALTANALTANGLKDPLGRQLLKYVVSCALDDKDSITMSIDGKSYTFPGGLGLAEEWGKKGGKCDGECQRWVSACVLSRVDFLGVEEIISVRGANPALKTDWREFFQYPNAEGTYFGNIFAPGMPMYGCVAPGKDEIPRVCGPSIDNCPMKIVGSCEKVCGSRTFSGAFVDCSSSGNARKPEIFHESISVFLTR